MRLSNFQFSSDELKDKPAIFANKSFNRLPGKGMSSSLLVKILPYMLASIMEVPDGCQIWKMLQLLHRYRELILAEEFDLEMIEEVEQVTHQYYSLREINSSVFTSMKPKHHYTLHTSENILYHGPPVRGWTARY